MDKSRKTDTFDEINALHERAQQMAREYESAISSGDFSMALSLPRNNRYL